MHPIKLRGGPQDGLETELMSLLEVVGFPRVEDKHDAAEVIAAVTLKRHSWDDDALLVHIDYYQRTSLIEDGQVIYEPKPDN